MRRLLVVMIVLGALVFLVDWAHRKTANGEPQPVAAGVEAVK